MVLGDGLHDVAAGKIAAVVTVLEMKARPSLRPEPDAVPWTLRRVAPVPLDWYRDLFARTGADWLWFSRLQMSDEALGAILANPDVEVYAVEVGNRAEGLLELDFREPGQCELAFFGLTGPLIGKGAGRSLMNFAIDRAWQRPIGRFWVHSCSLDHPAALEFYCRSGFVPLRRQVEIADDPRLSGTLPRTAAPRVPMI